MNISGSQCSSGCESGWTMYLDQMSESTDPYKRRGFVQVKEGAQYVNQDQEDEDLSMVSDASSGPPRGISVSEDKKKSKTKEKGVKKKQSLCLDDTATSPNYHISQGNVGASEQHNVLHFEGESVKKKQLSLFKSSTKGKSGSLLGRKRQ
ncbi:hypothetical protein CDL12_15784 [Handroanthus impetiginosus]|uniref:Uncharacterized protein n=1 Tax=Handroanthus impetiginosus TaxID=429701 RepID=A0A2G9H248_9LAMI|nr:hypothetical protein CDL12_15784 [Handroanthus impetiginosus]